MKKFLKERSKILLVSTVICIILFVLCIPELINYSKSVNEEVMLYNEFMVNKANIEADAMATALRTGDFLTIMLFYKVIMFGLLMIASTFNVVGFIYKKLEFLLISIVLFTINLVANFHLMDIGGILIFSSLILLNIVGYILQYKINKKTKKLV